jgi:hypothetical protein
MPEKPKIKTIEDFKEEKEKKDGKLPFDIREEFDLKTYDGRFWSQVNKVNPLLFFTPKKRIQQAQEEMFKYNVRNEAAHNMGSKVYLTPEEIVRVKQNNAIVGSAIHPDTNKIIPFYMRLSGFVVFNFPIVFAVLFVKN